MHKNNFLSKDEIHQIGFKKIGKNNLISRDAKFYNPKKIEIGNNCRIDDFVIFSTSKKNILIGNNVTIGRSSHLNGSGGIIIKNNVILSTFVCIHSSNHQYRDRNKKNFIYGKVEILNNVIIGSNAVIIGPVKMKERSSLGAMSLLKKNINRNNIYAGIPADKIK